jgi:hypothetical protein
LSLRLFVSLSRHLSVSLSLCLSVSLSLCLSVSLSLCLYVSLSLRLSLSLFLVLLLSLSLFLCLSLSTSLYLSPCSSLLAPLLSPLSALRSPLSLFSLSLSLSLYLSLFLPLSLSLSLSLPRRMHTMRTHNVRLVAHISVWNLTEKMLGPRWKPFFKGKAKETHCLLEFAVVVLETYLLRFRVALPEVQMEFHFLLEAGKSAMRFDTLIEQFPENVPSEVQNELLQEFLRHEYLFTRAGGDLIPKHHMIIHGIQRSGVLGSLKSYNTYRDENLNKVIAVIARSVHRESFAETTHRKFDIMQRLNLRQAVT